MAFMGELRDIGTADLLYLLAIRQQSGRLAIAASGDEVSLLIYQGRMIVVTSNNPAMRLGRMLVQLEYLTNDRLREALRFQEQRGVGRSLGTILVREGFISDDQLSHCVEEQCIEVLSRIIVANEGVFVFHAGERPSARTEIVPLNPDRIMLGATRRADEITALKDALPDPAIALTVTELVDQYADQTTDTEAQITAALYRNPTTMRNLEEIVQPPDIELWRAMVNLRERGVVRGIDELSVEGVSQRRSAAFA